MVAKRIDAGNSSKPRGRPATTPEAREMQMVSMAFDLVEERLANGTASAQETLHYLRIGATEQREKIKKLENENKLLEARVEQISASQHNSELYEDVIRMMKIYTGEEPEEPNFY